MKKRGFTLVELMVVISIIVVRAGLVLAGLTIAQNKAEQVKAKADVANLLNAVKRYEMDYNELPLPLSLNGITENSNSNKFTALGSVENDDEMVEYDKLLQLLTQMNITDGNNTDAPNYLNNRPKKERRNGRGLKFLDAPPDFTEEGMLDPWGSRYVILLDSDYDDIIVLDGKEYNATVMVYSCGPNGVDNGGHLYGVNSNDKDDDDVLGW